MMHRGIGGWGRVPTGGMGHGGRMGIDEEGEGGQIYDHKIVTRMLSYLRPHWPRVALAIVAMLVYSATVVALPAIVKWIIDDYIREKDLSGINIAVVVFVGVALLQFVSSYIQVRVMAFVGQRVLYALRIHLFSHIQSLSMSFFDRNEVGKVMSRVQNDVQQLQELLSGSGIIMTVADVLSLAGIVVVMVGMSPRLAVITLLVVPLLFVMLLVWQLYARRSFMRVRRAIAVVNSGLQENISGVRVVQSLNRERGNMRRFGRSNTENLDANLEAGRYAAVLLPSVEVLTSIGLALVVFFGGSMVLDDHIEVGVLVAFALYIFRFFEPIRRLTMEYGSLQRAMVSGARIFEILDVKPEITDKHGSVQISTVRGEVRYEGVSFHYDPDVPVLQNVDLHVAAGSTVALVGPTGAGKTTVVSLLLRLYEVTEGRITIDGKDLRDFTLDSLARQMSIVPQEPFLFSGTVEENIRYNREQLTTHEIIEASKVVGAHEFITSLECGYETIMHERGGNLSVGQRQLISFARALASQPRILILDEATANIDTHSELLVQRALSKLFHDRTALIIAHRLSTVRNADLIVVIDGGRIVEKGTHLQLMTLNGHYARLYSYLDTRSEER